jgi:DNA-directed RNA polymerase sigma subunit (sigma70/sigma32)
MNAGLSAMRLLTLTANQSLILQLRALGATYREVSKATGISPRKVKDAEVVALRKVVRFLEQQAFLGDH